MGPGIGSAMFGATFNLKLFPTAVANARGGGVLDFGLDEGVPPGPRNPNPCLEVKKGTHV